MIQTILVIACLLCGAGGIAVAAWSVHHTHKMARLQQGSAQTSDVQAPQQSGVDVMAFRDFQIGEIARAFAMPRHLLRDPAPRVHVHFDTWLKQRTERAHREFMERTASLPRCDGRESLAEKLKRYFGDRKY